ncbi:MAG: DUF859 domain-containing protein [Lachnospiraceae bacterium]|nr:DUF859 domain-containing protein [Lachnospiraceae bacterium]
MATSGRIETGTVQGRGIRFDWWQNWQSVENNQTNIGWKIYGVGNSGWVKSGGFLVQINGQTVCDWSTDNRIQLYDAQVVASGSLTLSHDNNGNKSFSVHVEAAVYEYNRNVSANGTFALNNIARASTPSCITYPNNTYNVGKLGDTITIHTNRKGDFTHTVRYDWYGVAGTIATNVTNNCQWTIPVDSFAKKFRADATQMEGTIYLDTYYSGRLVGTKFCKFGAKLPDTYIPTINSLNVSLDNSGNTVVNSWGVGVKGYSKAKITATGSGIYNSTISAFNITSSIDLGAKSVSGKTLSYTSGVIQNDGVLRCSVRAVDTRGRLSNASIYDKSIIIYPYSNPTLSMFSVNRNTSNAKKIILNTAWNFSSVNGKNSITATLKYKKKSSTGWTVYNGSINNGITELSGDFEETSGYDFIIVVTDALGNSVSLSASVSTIDVLLDFKAGGKGLGIGKVAETDSVEIALPIKVADADGNLIPLVDFLMPIGYIIWSKVFFDPNTLYKGTKWVRIKDRFLWAEGDRNKPGYTSGESTVSINNYNLPNESILLYNNSTTGKHLDGGSTAWGGTSNKQWLISSGSDLRRAGALGGQTPINIMPPNMSAFCWERIA